MNNSQEESYRDLKRLLLDQKYKITREYPPSRVEAEKGSILAVTPRGMKRRLGFEVRPQSPSGSRLVAEVRLHRGHLAQLVIAVVVFGVLVAASFFYAGLLATHSETGSILLQIWGVLMLTFLVADLVSGIYIQVKRDDFADAILRGMP